MSLVKNKVVKNAFWIVLCKILQSVFALIIGMLTARYLGPSNYGLINYAASLVSFVVPITYLGLNSTLVHELVNDKPNEGKILGTSIILSIISAIFCIVGMISFVSVAHWGQTDTIIVCGLYGLLLLFQAIDLIQYWFQANYLSKFTSIVMLIAYLVVSVYKVFLLVLAKGVYWFAVSNSIDYLIIAISLLIIYKKMGGERLQFSFHIAKKLLSNSKHYILSGLMINMFTQTDKIMIKLFIDDSANGFYSAAVVCATLTSFVFAAIIDSARPSVFESIKSSKESFEKNISRLYCIIIYISLAQCIVMTVGADFLVSLLFGEAYKPAASVLRIVVWYTTFSYIGSVRSIWILAEKKQKYLWIINLSGALLNVILNLIMIPIWNIYGAAIASLVTQLFTNFVIGLIIKPIRRNNLLMLKGLNIRLILDYLKSNKSG